MFLFPWSRMGKPQWRLCIHGRTVPRACCATLARMDVSSRTRLKLMSLGDLNRQDNFFQGLQGLCGLTAFFRIQERLTTL